MTATLLTSDKLALFGGRPISPTPLSWPTFPPRDTATAQRLFDVYMSGNWSWEGEAERAFTKGFAKYHGAKHGIFMANGTVTLQASLHALAIGAGDEVILPALTWVATSSAIRYVGATPVFVDVEPNTLCLDPAKVESAITERTRAIIPVHLYGSTADIDALLAIAKKHDLAMIEDCAHAHGGKWSGRGLGSWGDIGSFSFQQSKTLSAGEGGICLTNDDDLADRLFQCKMIGYSRGAMQGRAQMPPPQGLVCHNFRGTEFPAVILQPQLEKLEERIGRYNRNAKRLEYLLAGIEGVRVQSRGRLADPQSYYGLVLLFEGALAAIGIDRVNEALRAEGVTAFLGTYGAVYGHPLFNEIPSNYRIHERSCPVSEGLGTKNSLVLPHQWLNGEDGAIETIAEAIRKIGRNARALSASAG